MAKKLTPPQVECFTSSHCLKVIMEWRKNIDGAIQVIPSLVTASDTLTVYINAITNEGKMKELLQRIKYDSEKIMKLPQRVLLERGSMMGRKITIFYGIYIVTATVLYSVLPLTPIILNAVKPLNESRSKKFLFEVEYFIDNDKYYYHIMVHEYLAVVIVIHTLIAIDTMFMVYVQHACTLFMILSNRLKYLHIIEDEYIDDERMKQLESTYNNRSYTKKECHKIYEQLKDGIKFHCSILSYSKLLQSSFTTAFAIQLLLTVLTISFAGIMILINLNNFDELMRHISFIAGHLVRFFFQCFSGQRLLNYSFQLYKDACSSMWYLLPKKFQVVYNFLLMRISNPCMLTAGVFATMSMETYLSVTQTAMSYFTVLSSMR